MASFSKPTSLLLKYTTTDFNIYFNISSISSFSRKGTMISLSYQGETKRLEFDSSAETDTAETFLLDNVITSVNKGKFISLHLLNSGSSDMTVDGSTTPVEFSLTPPSGKKWFISRVIISMEDTNMSWKKFGSLTPLTNGVSASFLLDSVSHDLLDGATFKENASFTKYCYDAEINTDTTDILRARWTFSKSGTFIELRNNTSDKIAVTINDDLTSLDSFQIIMQGHEVDE